MNHTLHTDKGSEEKAGDSIHSAQKLLKQNRRQGLAALNDLFRAGKPPDPPLEGAYAGELVTLDIAPGITQLGQLITAVWMPWQGKQFDLARTQGDNIFDQNSRVLARLIFPFYRGFVDNGAETYRAFVFQTSVGPGRIDTDRQVLKIDYDLASNPRLSIRRILDELVQVADGVYLGKLHFKWWWGSWQVAGYFSLRNKK